MTADYDNGADQPPNDQQAEQALLGDIMRDARILGDLTLTGRDFYQPRHETVWNTMRSLNQTGRPVDPITLAGVLKDGGHLERIGGAPYLHTLYEASFGSPTYHAERITETSRRRQLIKTARQITQAANEGHPSETVIDTAITNLHGISSFSVDVDTLMTVDEFVNQSLPEQEWVIPGLLGRGDRLVLTGGEGLGKSTLIRQFAACTAAGIDPFTRESMPPQTVLVIDAENPKRIMMNRFADLTNTARQSGYTIDPTRLWIDRRPDGIDLNNPRDRKWLTQRVEMVNPDLLVIGPAYKLYVSGGSQREEDLARIVTNTLDQIRETAGCALILEHHSPHMGSNAARRDVRPIGSSLWLRWPEFGYGIRAVPDDEDETAGYRRLVDFIAWRGPRDERPFPTHLERGLHGWPWMPARQEKR